MKGWLKMVMEIGPLALFFGLYKYQGIMTATAGLMAATFVSMAVCYYYERKIPVAALISTIFALALGGITLLSGDSTFIKMKPTFFCGIIGALLLLGVWMKKGLMRYIMGNSISMSDKGWLVLSLRWGLFFIMLAVLNEIIWRSFPEDFWVKFKVFGILPLTLIFAISQVRVMKKFSL